MTGEISRRDLLLSALGLGAGYVAARYSKDDDSESLMIGVGAGERTISERLSLGDWPAIITNDWESVDVNEYPTLVYHLADGLSLFSDAQTYRTQITARNINMDVITTENPADVSINTFPTLLIEIGSDTLGSQTLIREGDI